MFTELDPRRSAAAHSFVAMSSPGAAVIETAAAARAMAWRIPGPQIGDNLRDRLDAFASRR